ncbi:BatD family protein [Hydrogenimonas sp.]
MGIPGRWLGLWLLPMALLAGAVRLDVDENPIIQGEPVEMTIEAEGERVEIPDISEIGGYPVTNEGMQRLERMDGNRSVVRWVKFFAFTPKRDVQIPPIEVWVDGRRYRTEPLGVRVLAKKAPREGDFCIELLTDRHRACVGEPVKVTVRFRERRSVPVMSVDFVPMRFTHFWVKQVGKRRRYAEGEYLVHETTYLFFPQKEGNLTIGPAAVKAAVSEKIRDAFGFIVRRPRWLTFESGEANVTVMPLPPGVSLVGDFSMRVEVSPKTVAAGEPVRVDVTVEGEGNIEDFRLPEPAIEGVTLYPQKPRIEQRYEHGRYRASWRRRYVLIAEHDFTFPSLTLRYLDSESGRIVTKRSEPVTVRVTGSVEEAPTGVADDRERKEGAIMATVWLYVALGGAFLAGMGTMYLLTRRRRKSASKKPRAFEGGEAAMLQRLMPHISSSKEAARMAEALYGALYEGEASKVRKKEFEKLMKRLEG